MELSRQEYPALLSSLQPAEAVSILNDRVAFIKLLNNEAADWLSERRKVEELYVQGLKKLANKRHPDVASNELGIFRFPWQTIVRATGELAQSHGTLAARIGSDIEQPLRDYQVKNREMQAITTIQGNLHAMAKEVEDAQRKSEKSKVKAGKTSKASEELQTANQQWTSQAPYVFEQLQALDESRVNHLRDVLTQFQTHEADLVERNRVIAEECLNVMLTISTSDEISTFVAKASGPTPVASFRSSTRRASSPGNHEDIAMIPPIPRLPRLRPPTAKTFSSSSPSRSTDEARVNRASTSAAPSPQPNFAPEPPTPKKGGFSGGLRRLGTVMSRKKTDPNIATDSAFSDKARKRQSRNPLRRGTSEKNMQQIPSPSESTSELPSSSAARPPTSSDPNSTRTTTSVTPQIPPIPQMLASQTTESREQNGGSTRPSVEPSAESSADAQHLNLPNGTRSPQEGSINEPPTPSDPPAYKSPQMSRDAEGFTIPPAGIDAISQAEQEAATCVLEDAPITVCQPLILDSENDSPSFKLDIRSNPIQEEGGDSEAVLSNVANRLRDSVVMPPRRLGPLRGRRDVRNTIFVPNPSTPESAPIPESSLPLMSPMHKAMQLSDEHRGSDAHSITSSHSIGSLTSNQVKHPHLEQPGLNASIIETINTSFSAGQVTKTVVTGEVALAFNETESTLASEFDSLRLGNFAVLEKVAPNPQLITQIPSRSGEYNVNLSQLASTTVAFKYQVHLEDVNLAAYAPITLTPNWKIEPKQASVILNYSFNPGFASEISRSVTLQNVFVAINVENSRALSCLSKPVGHFLKEKSLIYWKLGDLVLSAYDDGPQKLLARFTTDGEAKPGSVEAKWEISGEAAAALGSGLSVNQASGSKEDSSSDPFADESAAPPSSAAVYKDVPTVKKLLSGKYMA